VMRFKVLHADSRRLHLLQLVLSKSSVADVSSVQAG